jgi:hypothetical protein
MLIRILQKLDRLVYSHPSIRTFSLIAECSYIEFHILFVFMLNGIVLSVIMLNVIIVNVVMLSAECHCTLNGVVCEM